MQKTESKLTVCFDEPFWVGIYERVSDGKLEVCKIIFGSEPKDYQVYEYLHNNWCKLRFSPPVTADSKQEVKINPKRLRREVKNQICSQGMGSKSQQALKLQQEAVKAFRIEKTSQHREEERQQRYELRQQKQRQKHRGR